jgi:hypothetical protein
MSIDAMQQALEALEYHQEQTRPIHKTQETITALRKAIREAALDGLAQTSQEIEWDTSDMAHRSGGLTVDQPDLFVTAAQQPLVDEIKRLTELNRQLVAAAKELGAADDVAEWDNAWSKIAKLFKESV